MRAWVPWAQAIGVTAPLLAWLWFGPDAKELLHASTTLAVVAHVAVTAALALALVAAATFRDRPWAASLGLARVPAMGALGWGLAGAALCYVANILAVGLYFGARMIAGPLVLVFGPPPGGVVQTELAHKAEWASRLGALPLPVSLGLALFAGVYEEVVFRGFLLGRLRAGLARVPPRAGGAAAVVLSSAAFAAGHGYQGALGLAQTFAAGVALALLATYRRSIWPCIVAHVTIDAFGLVALHFLRPLLDTLRPTG
jgi:membrane protease YdiL (CAAX protease family)